MCRNVQITLGINLRHSLVLPRTQPNLPTAPQTKNGNHFFLLTSQKIDTFIDFFLIRWGGTKICDRSPAAHTNWFESNLGVFSSPQGPQYLTRMAPVGSKFSLIRKKSIMYWFFERLGEGNCFHFSFEELWASWADSGAKWGAVWDLYLG